MVKEKNLKPARVVLDTNCIISALLFTRGRLSWLRAGWQNGAVLPLVSHDTAAELLRVLKYSKFGLDVQEREALLADFLPYAETVTLSDHPRKDLPEIDDPDDMKFLLLAVAASADVLVTGDSDLLALKPGIGTIQVLSPAEFFDWLEAKGCPDI